MKQIILGTSAFALFLAGACQNNNNTEKEEAQKLAAEAIEIHDEIMPKVSRFNKDGLFIDSLLQNPSALQSDNVDSDTAATRENLHNLKINLESATDKMMSWMKAYTLDSADVDYQQMEIEQISDLRTEFERVSNESDDVLGPFKR